MVELTWPNQEGRSVSRRRRFHIDSKDRCEGTHPLCGALSRRGLNSIKLAYEPYDVGRMAGPIAASVFNRIGQYTSSPGHRAYCYTELAISFLAVAETIVNSHCAYPRRDDQAE